MYKVAVDIGGTFTDLVVEDDNGHLATSKVLSTPPHLVDGVIAALELSGTPADQLSLFIHGTTAGLNALLERRGARVALVTTEGFRDTYLIGRGHRASMYDLRYRKPPRLLDRASIFEVRERLAADGSVLVPVSRESVDAVSNALKAGDYEAIAVCLLHSYANPVHELEVRRLLQSSLRGAPIVVSHEVAPEWREFERTSTTALNAYLSTSSFSRMITPSLTKRAGPPGALLSQLYSMTSGYFPDAVIRLNCSVSELSGGCWNSRWIPVRFSSSL